MRSPPAQGQPARQGHDRGGRRRPAAADLCSTRSSTCGPTGCGSARSATGRLRRAAAYQDLAVPALRRRRRRVRRRQPVPGLPAAPAAARQLARAARPGALPDAALAPDRAVDHRCRRSWSACSPGSPGRGTGSSGCCSATAATSASRTRSSAWTSASTSSTTRSGATCSTSASPRPRWPCSARWRCTTSTAGCGCRASATG